MAYEDKQRDLVATFQKILEAPELYEDDKEKGVCQRLIESLPEELVEHAANTSFAYWYLASQPDTCPGEDVKKSMAMREARRHLACMAGNFDKSLAQLTTSCEYRRDHKLDLLRTCFKDEILPREDEQKKSEEIAALVEEDLRRQLVVMRGQDRASRAVMIKYPRMFEGTTQDSYVMAQIYMAERSIASTEFLSLGREERSLAIYDYTGFESKNAPPYAAQVAAATLLQKLYPERLQTLVMLEPPFWLKGVMSLLSPFLSAKITENIKLVTGTEERTELFQKILDPEHTVPLLLPNGKLTDPVNLNHFLKAVPFYGLYDDVKYDGPHEVIEKPPVKEQVSLTQTIWSSIF